MGRDGTGWGGVGCDGVGLDWLGWDRDGMRSGTGFDWDGGSGWIGWRCSHIPSSSRPGAPTPETAARAIHSDRIHSDRIHRHDAPASHSRLQLARRGQAHPPACNQAHQSACNQAHQSACNQAHQPGSGCRRVCDCLVPVGWRSRTHLGRRWVSSTLALPIPLLGLAIPLLPLPSPPHHPPHATPPAAAPSPPSLAKTGVFAG